MPSSLTALQAIRRVDRQSAADDVLAQLTELIQLGRMKAGERLPSEITLGKAFGVSRPVIREALRGLGSLGLVVSKMGAGTYVSNGEPISRRLLLGLYTPLDLHEVRTYLELPSARLAAERATPEQVTRLQELVALMKETNDFRAYAELDAQFHIELAKCTGNPVHMRLLTDLHELIVDNSALALSVGRSRLIHATTEHRRIADAVSHHDPSAAAAAIQHHLARTAEVLASPAFKQALSRRNHRFGNTKTAVSVDGHVLRAKRTALRDRSRRIDG